MKLGKPKPLWAVVCRDGTPYSRGNRRDARAIAGRRSEYCSYCDGIDQPHRVVEYRPVEETSKSKEKP